MSPETSYAIWRQLACQARQWGPAWTSCTRLGDVLIDQIAAACGQPGAVVRMRRKRAERKLVAALQRGELAVPRRVAAAAG